MYRNEIQLNDFFSSEFMEKALRIYGFSKKNDYPSLSQELKRYKSRLKSTPRLSGIFNFGETFIQRIKIDDNNFYVVAWNIGAAKKAIKKINPPLSNFSLNKIIHFVDQRCINESHLGVALNNNAPIIMASYPQMMTKDKVLIIDGNHRVTVKQKDGQKKIPGYILEPDQHLPVMVSEVHRKLYKIHFNYYKIASYIGGIINEKELNEGLYPL